jgi:hypothetical protein
VPEFITTGRTGLPPLGGRLLFLYKFTWWAVLVAALYAMAWSLIDPIVAPEILILRLGKAAILVVVASILRRRRCHDPVAAMLSLAFLLWIISSSIEFVADSVVFDLVDRCRFLLFALALVFFPDGAWQSRWTLPLAIMIAATFLVGVAEASGLIGSAVYLPVAIACVLAALATLLYRYRLTEDGVQKQQFKWIALGLVSGITSILVARAAASLTSGTAIPLIGRLLIEGLFQSGIIIIALGFLISLLRYRLYDAETVISRSAVYAGLTLALVGTFAASETIIQSLGERYFGSGIGDLSGGIAAAIAAVLLTPLHDRISNWAEHYFQHDLTKLKDELPDLLMSLSSEHSLKSIASVVLRRLEQAMELTGMALIIDDRLIATRGHSTAPRRASRDSWSPTGSECGQNLLPLRLALHGPPGKVRGWLLLGTRPDGSLLGRDELEALNEVMPPLQRTLLQAAARDRMEKKETRRWKSLVRQMKLLTDRMENLESRS